MLVRLGEDSLAAVRIDVEAEDDPSEFRMNDDVPGPGLWIRLDALRYAKVAEPTQAATSSNKTVGIDRFGWVGFFIFRP